MKKFISALIVAVLMVSTTCFSAFAASDFTVTVDTVSADKGQVVGVPVKVTGNTGIWGMTFNVNFDTSVLSVVEVRNNANVFENGEIMIGPSNFSDGYVRFLATSNDLTKNITKNGTLCTIYFKVSENANYEKTKLAVSFGENDMCDNKGQQVEVKSANGALNIEKGANATTVKPDNTNQVIATTAQNQNSTVKNNSNDSKVTDSNGNVVNDNSDYTFQTVTDKNGNEVTDKNGNAVTEKVTQTNAANSNNESIGEQNKDTKPVDSSCDWYYGVVIVVLVLAIAGIVAYILIKKKKAKTGTDVTKK